MIELSAGKASVLALSAVAVGFFVINSASSIFAQSAEARAYCHANSGESEYTYHNNPAWVSHMENNGTPLSGHELDFFTFEGNTDCVKSGNTPTPTVTPSVTPSVTITPTPTLTGTPTVTVTPTPTTTSEVDVCTNVEGVQTSIPEGWFQVSAGSTECRQFEYGGPSEDGGSTPQGQVLGASTLAATGSTADYMLVIGLILTATSLYGLFAPAFLKK